MVNGIKVKFSKTTGYTLVETITVLFINFLIFIMVSSFIICIFKFTTNFKNTLADEQYIYQGLIYIDNVIRLNNVNDVEVESLGEAKFINQSRTEKNFNLVYSPINKYLRIVFAASTNSTPNYVIRGIKNVEFYKKNNILYIKITSIGGKEIEKSCALRKF